MSEVKECIDLIYLLDTIELGNKSAAVLALLKENCEKLIRRIDAQPSEPPKQ